MLALWVSTLLLVPAGAAAPYLQYQVDAARTGASEDPGPASFDVAFKVQLPGQRPAGAPLLIKGRMIYAAIRAVGDDPTLSENAVQAIDIDTLEVETLIDLQTAPTALGGSDDSLFVVDQDGMGSYTWDGDGPAWQWPIPPLLGLADELRSVACGAPAIDGGVVFLACTVEAQVAETPFGLLDPVEPRLASFVAAVNVSDGQALWVAEPRTSRFNLVPTDVEDPAPRLGRVAVHRDKVFASGFRTGEMAGDRVVVVFDRADGQNLGRIELFTGEPGPLWYPALPAVAGAGDRFFLRSEYLLKAYDIESLNERWKQEVRPAHDPDTGSVFEAIGYVFDALAVDGGVLYAVGEESIYAFTHEGDSVWVNDGTPEWEGIDGMLVAGSNIIVGRSFSGNAGLHVFSTVDGHGLWRGGFRMLEDDDPNRSRLYQFNPTLGYSVGDSIVAVSSNDGLVTALGVTEASIRLPDLPPVHYPGAGEPFSIDLTGTRDGAQATRTEFRVHWEIGDISPWTQDPVFTHTYDEARNRTVLIEARNDAGQTASMEFVAAVGYTPPPGPTFFETAFNRDNQDTTWGVIGLTVTLLGAMIAILLRHRRRSRLERELEAIETAYTENKDNPARCAAALRERQARALDLLRRGHIEDSHFAVLDRRIADLSRSLRIHSLDNDLSFLPLGIARTLERFLADGRISDWERHEFLRQLDHARQLTKDQKTLVARRVNEWFAEDQGETG